MVETKAIGLGITLPVAILYRSCVEMVLGSIEIMALFLKIFGSKKLKKIVKDSQSRNSLINKNPLKLVYLNRVNSWQKKVFWF